MTFDEINNNFPLLTEFIFLSPIFKVEICFHCRGNINYIWCLLVNHFSHNVRIVCSSNIPSKNGQIDTRRTTIGRISTDAIILYWRCYISILFLSFKYVSYFENNASQIHCWPPAETRSVRYGYTTIVSKCSQVWTTADIQ